MRNEKVLRNPKGRLRIDADKHGCLVPCDPGTRRGFSSEEGAALLEAGMKAEFDT